MNDFLKVLLNIRSLRAAVRDLPFEQLQEIKEKFDTVVQEQLKAAEVDQAAKLEHEKKLAEFRETVGNRRDLAGRSAQWPGADNRGRCGGESKACATSRQVPLPGRG